MTDEKKQSQDEIVINIIDSVFGNREDLEKFSEEGVERTVVDMAERTVMEMAERSVMEMVERC